MVQLRCNRKATCIFSLFFLAPITLLRMQTCARPPPVISGRIQNCYSTYKNHSQNLLSLTIVNKEKQNTTNDSDKKSSVHSEDTATIMSQEGKFLLESILGKLLGFDEGAGDLLNHLLTIESEEVRFQCPLERRFMKDIFWQWG